MKTRLATQKDLNKIVEIHQIRFNNFFLSSLGKFFLKEFYKGFLFFPGLLLILEDDEEMVGFAAGSYSNNKFFTQLIKNNLIGFFKAGLIILFTKPIALFRLTSNLKSSTKEELQFSELLSIATISNKKGYGKFLLESFEDIVFQKNEELPISLTTDFFNNDKVVQFYKDAGYHVYKEFESYEGRRMYRFIKKNKNLQ